MDDRTPDVSAVASPPRRALSPAEVDPDAGRLIDAGGQAQVYELVLDGVAQVDRVAVKQPSGAETLDRDDVAAFLEEAETWSRLDSIERRKPRWEGYDHIVGVIDAGETSPWIAMEYMDGGSLRDRLDANPDGLPVDEALWVGEAVCRGLEVAHSRGVAHLDLKPANVLFRETSDGVWDVPKVADWGLARVLFEQTGSIDGLTATYAAPEQLEPEEFGEPDELTDVYAAGAVVYEMLTGDPPHTGGRLQLMRKILSGEEPEPPSERRPAVDPALDSVVLKALAAEKRDRYPGITHLQQALRSVRTGSAAAGGASSAGHDRSASDSGDGSRTATREGGGTQTAEDAGGERVVDGESVSSRDGSLSELDRVDASEARNLAEAGVGSVDDLASADDLQLARELDRSPNEVARWIGEAKAHTSGSARSTTPDGSRTADSDSVGTGGGSYRGAFASLDRVDDSDARALESIGVTTLRELAAVDDVEVAGRLDRSPNEIARWRAEANEST